MGKLTLETLKSMVPSIAHSSVDEELVHYLNKLSEDKDMDVQERDNLLKFIKEQLADYGNRGTVSTKEYLNACKYVYYMKMGYSVTDSYKRTFPNKVEEMIRKDKQKEISKVASLYKATKTVARVIKSSIIDLDLFYYSERMKVLDGLLRISLSESESARNRIEASKAFLAETASKLPNTNQINVQVNTIANDALTTYMQTVKDSAKQLQEYEEISSEPIRLKKS